MDHNVGGNVSLETVSKLYTSWQSINCTNSYTLLNVWYIAELNTIIGCIFQFLRWIPFYLTLPLSVLLVCDETACLWVLDNRRD